MHVVIENVNDKNSKEYIFFFRTIWFKRKEIFSKTLIFSKIMSVLC